MSFADLLEKPKVEEKPSFGRFVDMEAVVEPEPVERPMMIGAAPEPTGLQKFKRFFVGDRPPLPPNADQIEKFDRVFDIAIGSPLRVFLKYAKGRTLNVPDLMWAGIKRITPDSMWDKEVKNMNLDQAMDWAAGYDPSGFEKTVGDLAEFMGRLQTASEIGTKIGVLGGTPSDITALIRASETAKLYGLGAGFELTVKNLAEMIDPTEAVYGAEGKEAILRDMAMGAILSYAHTGLKAIWKSLYPTERAIALKLLGLKKTAGEEEIIKATRRMVLKTHPDKVKGLTEKFKEVMVARELLMKGPKKDIIYRKQPLKPPAIITGEIAPPSVIPAPTMPGKPLVTPPAAIKPAVEGRRGVLYEKDKGLYDETKPEEQVRISTLTEEGKQEALDFGEQLEEGTVLESADGSTHHLVGSQFVLSFDAETGKFLVASQKTTGGRAMNYDPDLSTINIFARSRVVGNKGKETDSVLSFSKSEAKPTKVAPEVAQRELKTPIPENKQLAEIRKQIDAAYRNKEVEVLADIIENKLDPLPATFEKNVLQGHAQVLQMDMEARLEEVAKPLLKKKVIAKPEIVEPAKATKGQIAQAHIIAKEKAFVSEKGKMRPGYRRLAKAMSGETSMKKMSSEQASRFIDALKRLPEPTYRKGKLVPPSIPRTTKLATLKQFQRKYRKPTLLKYITSQTYYAEVLGVKEIVRPLEEGKQRFDLEFRKASLEVDRKIDEIDKFYETTIKEKAAAKLKNQPTKAVAKIRDLLDKYEEPPKGLTIEEAQIFNWFRDLNREVLRRENEVRKALDYPLIKERKAYVRHVADVMATEMLQGKYPFPEGKAYWAQKAVSQKIYNPMEFQRKLAEEIEGLFTKDLGYATKSMLWTGLKEIHLSKPLRFFSEQLGAISKDLPIYKGLSPQEIELLQKTVVMPVGTKRWVIDYVNQVIKGQETWLDTQVNNLVTESGLSGLFNKILKPFGRTISRKPITNMFQKGGRLVISGVLGWRPKLLIRNKFQSFQNLALYTTKANLKGTIPASKQLREIIDNSLFIKGYTGFEELPKDLMGKMERAWLAPYQWTAVSNAVQAMKTAYWDTMELITKPKYKEFGWSDPKRTYKEKPEFLYPSEKKKMIREMELGAGATQYQYIPLGMPEAFRHKALIPFTRLQSWWMNHFAKFHREAGHRLIKGEPMWSDGTVKLPWSRRLGWFRYLIIGGLVLNTLGYTRSFLFGAAPTALPPAGQLALSSYFYLTSFFMAGSEEWKKWQREKAKKQIHNALLTFIPGYLAYRDYEAIWSGRKNLKSLFFYEKLKKKKKKIIISARRKELRGY